MTRSFWTLSPSDTGSPATSPGVAAVRVATRSGSARTVPITSNAGRSDRFSALAVLTGTGGRSFSPSSPPPCGSRRAGRAAARTRRGGMSWRRSWLVLLRRRGERVGDRQREGVLLGSAVEPRRQGGVADGQGQVGGRLADLELSVEGDAEGLEVVLLHPDDP